MTRLPFFIASCPGCSTKKQLELSRLGHDSECVACGKTFQAVGADSSSAALDDPVHYWIQFTEHPQNGSENCCRQSKDLGRTPR